MSQIRLSALSTVFILLLAFSWNSHAFIFETIEVIGKVGSTVAKGVKELDRIFGSLDKDAYRSKDDEYIFFEGNNCTQNIVGSFWTKTGHNAANQNVKEEAVNWFKNDEARSVLIRKSYEGEILRVWDEPNWENRARAPRTHITFEKNITKPFCIGTFEVNYVDSELGITILKIRNGQIDGKISRVMNH